MNGVGRNNQDLMHGAQDASFAPRSVYDLPQVLQAANGQSEADRARQPMRGPGRGLNAESESTYQSHLWIDPHPRRTFG